MELLSYFAPSRSFPASLFPAFPPSLLHSFPHSLLPAFPRSLVPLFPHSLLPAFPSFLSSPSFFSFPFPPSPSRATTTVPPVGDDRRREQRGPESGADRVARVQHAGTRKPHLPLPRLPVHPHVRHARRAHARESPFPGHLLAASPRYRGAPRAAAPAIQGHAVQGRDRRERGAGEEQGGRQAAAQPPPGAEDPSLLAQARRHCRGVVPLRHHLLRKLPLRPHRAQGKAEDAENVVCACVHVCVCACVVGRVVLFCV